MFSLDNFYNIVYTNFFNDARIEDHSFIPFGSSNVEDLSTNHLHVYLRDFHQGNKKTVGLYIPLILFYDQEPVNENIVSAVRIKYTVNEGTKHQYTNSTKRLKILAVSEKSEVVDKICKDWDLVKWYYFFHGFAALDWYRDLQYIPKFDNNFKKTFLCLNRLCTKDRSYRLTLVSKILEKDIFKDGLVSLTLDNIGSGTWQEELDDKNSKLSNNSKNLIKKQISSLQTNLVVDQELPPSYSSANFDYKILKMHKSALWNVVTETVFYHNKLHLTEKIFKPIISRRPFILVAAPGNLSYFRSYGFKTFDQWIDESYDDEKDHDKRLDMIVSELEKLCKLDNSELQQMHLEMQEILDYNFNHFFGNFRSIIVNEMVDNLEAIFARWNCNRIDGRGYDVSNINFKEIKKRLTS